MAGQVERTNISTGDPLTPQFSPAVAIAEGQGRTCIWVVYATNKAADAAAEKIREALSGASACAVKEADKPARSQHG